MHWPFLSLQIPQVQVWPFRGDSPIRRGDADSLCRARIHSAQEDHLGGGRVMHTIVPVTVCEILRRTTIRTVNVVVSYVIRWYVITVHRCSIIIAKRMITDFVLNGLWKVYPFTFPWNRYHTRFKIALISVHALYYTVPYIRCRLEAKDKLRTSSKKATFHIALILSAW